MNNEPPDPLDRLLDRFGQETPLLSESLGHDVRRRLARAEAKRRAGWWERLEAVFAQPAFAATFVMACVFLGLFLAEVRRSHRQDEYNRELVKSYLRLIDPLIETAEGKSSTQSPADKS